MRLLIMGAGVHGQAIADLAAEEGAHAAVAFTDADPALKGRSRLGLPVWGDDAAGVAAFREGRCDGDPDGGPQRLTKGGRGEDVGVRLEGGAAGVGLDGLLDDEGEGHSVYVEFSNADRQPLGPYGVAKQLRAGSIDFSRVGFSYDGQTPVLADLNLHIKPGQLAALVGPTGAGKTTIISLLPRFYDLTSGEIRIDGRDIRRFKIKSLREQISFVLQESLLFHAPVWQNIAYGKPEATRAEIVRAAQLANAVAQASATLQASPQAVRSRAPAAGSGPTRRRSVPPPNDAAAARSLASPRHA